MSTFSIQHGSASTSGKMVAVAATSTPGTTLHTAVAGPTSFDEIIIYATNISATAATLTVELGGGAAADSIVVNIPAQDGLHLVLPGARLNGGLLVKAFASTANVINCLILVNRDS